MDEGPRGGDPPGPRDRNDPLASILADRSQPTNSSSTSSMELMRTRRLAAEATFPTRGVADQENTMSEHGGPLDGFVGPAPALRLRSARERLTFSTTKRSESVGIGRQSRSGRPRGSPGSSPCSLIVDICRSRAAYDIETNMGIPR